ncbi:MAG TPA: acylphosphatase [Kofleriaceae bacterium]|jgi:acylphosphatase
MTRVRAIVTGRVQGVSFRATTCGEARRLGVVGWVRNLPDGSVELEAEGDAASVADLLAWCEHGPVGARVANVSTTETAVRGETSFTIR